MHHTCFTEEEGRHAHTHGPLDEGFLHDNKTGTQTNTHPLVRAAGDLAGGVEVNVMEGSRMLRATMFKNVNINLLQMSKKAPTCAHF